ALCAESGARPRGAARPVPLRTRPGRGPASRPAGVRSGLWSWVHAPIERIGGGPTTLITAASSAGCRRARARGGVPTDRNTRAGGGRLPQALAVWVVGLLVFLLAVFHRSSLAVAGLAAAERFDIGASPLATFTMLQLLVYAGMQIPVGLLVDRYGPRSVLLVGALTLTFAQAGFAFADGYLWALLARV